jgi:Arc/MetJ-type ribon-helix-helix transcriptional regulator
MSTQIAIRLSDDLLSQVDAAIERGAFPSRAAAVRAGIDLLMRRQRDDEIAEEYRRAYGDKPQDTRLLEGMAILAGEVIATRDAASEPEAKAS